MIDIALVGIGKIALDQHVPALKSSDAWNLAATVSRSGKVAGVESHADFDAFLKARPDIRVPRGTAYVRRTTTSCRRSGRIPCRTSWSSPPVVVNRGSA